MTRGFTAGAAVLVLVVALSACQAVTGRIAGTASDDATVTAAVKSRLAADRAASLTRVDVDTNSGTVYLNGTVETAEQKARAEQLAWQAQGVRGVVNNLQVQRR